MLDLLVVCVAASGFVVVQMGLFWISSEIKEGMLKRKMERS